MSNTKHLADMLKVCSILPVFAVMPAMATDEAKLGSDSYSTFFEALANAQDGNTHTVSLLRDVSDGKGSIVKSGSDVTIDFGGHSYTAIEVPVGSKGTETLMFQLLKDSNVTMKNGTLSTISDADNVFKMMLQNYSNLTLDNMIIDGTDENIQYVVSNNNGTTKIKNSKIIAGENGVALDAFYWPSNGYGDVVVDVENTEIIGSIEVTVDGTKSIAEDTKHELSINGGVLAAQTNGVSKIKNNGNLTLSNVDMNGNTGAGWGAAILNSAKVAADGGIAGRGIANITKVNFSHNEVTYDGGAIYNYNNGAMTISGSEFVSNKALSGFGGAIMDWSGVQIDGDTNFTGNIAKSGGAVVAYSEVKKTDVTGGRFENNHALADGGALGLYGLGEVTGTWFVDNTAGLNKKIDGVIYEAASDANGGGALFVGQKGKVTLNDVHFIDNETGVSGGAIHARHFLSDGAYLKMNTVEFDDNDAKKNGGAIASIYDGVIDVDNGTFTSNTAGQNGGAIYVGVDMNYGSSDGTGSNSTNHGTINFSGLNRFEGNVAGVAGGAIYNDAGGTVNFGGTTVFKDNKVGKYAGLNDIHNLGTVNILNGATVTMNGGVTGNTGTFNLAEGAVLNMGSSTIRQSSIVIDGTVFADVLTDGSSKYIDRADKEENKRENNGGVYAALLGNVTGSGSINLNVGSVGTYKMFNNATDITINAGKAYEVDVINGTDVKVTLKSVETLAGDTGLSQRAAGAISSLATSSSRNIQMVSLAAQKLLNSDDPDAIAKIEQETAKLNPEDKPVTQSVSTSLNNQVLSLTAGRMSGGATMSGRSGGDDMVQENGFWAQGLYNKSKSGSAFEGTTRGIALGMDTLIDNKYTLGAGFAYNNTDVSSGTRDTEIDSKTLFVYGQYKPNKWFANATLAYTMSEYTEHNNPFSLSYESVFDVDTFGAQLMTGYDFTTGITPEMGLRYLHVSQEEYETIGNITVSDTDFLTAVAGLKYAFYVQTDDMLKFRPELRAALTYDVVNDDTHATVTLPSVGASYNIEGKALNKVGGEFGIGLTAEYKGMEFSLMYDLDVHEDYTSQTGMIKFRGRF